MMGGEFKLSNKHLIMSREFYKEICNDLDRIRTSIDVKDARSHADYLTQKLKNKFEPPAYNINGVLSSHEREYKDSSRSLELSPLDETGKEAK